MSSSLKIERPWQLTSAGGGTLRIGHQYVALRDIRGQAMSAHEERDFMASLFNYSVYLVVAAVFLVLVVQGGWRERFLLATIFFAVVGATSLFDVCQAHRIRLYKLTLKLADGRTLDYTSGEPGEINALSAALRQVGIA